MTTHLRTLLIGEELLVADCSQQLIDRGHSVIGVVTSSAAVQTWATGVGVETGAGVETGDGVETGVGEVQAGKVKVIDHRSVERALLCMVSICHGPQRLVTPLAVEQSAPS